MTSLMSLRSCRKSSGRCDKSCSASVIVRYRWMYAIPVSVGCFANEPVAFFAVVISRPQSFQRALRSAITCSISAGLA
jgi:hypothetical protein